jgi:2-keto-4-pentenoate hydratase
LIFSFSSPPLNQPQNITLNLLGKGDYRTPNIHGKRFKREAKTMKRRLCSLGILGSVGFMAMALLVWAAPPLELIQKVEDAFEAKQPLPLVSQEIKGLTVDQAYEIQASLLRLREGKGEKISGYFVGLTDPAAQKRFAIQEPIWGVIFKSMVEGDKIIYQKGFRNVLVETEIGFRIGEDILEPVKDTESLKKAVVAVFPAIHLPDFAYADMKLITAGDLIASNVGTRKILIGETVKQDDPNAVTVKLFHNEAEIASGVGKNALGDQWGVLKWAVNDIIARGGKVKKDYIILTGVISKAIPGKAGKYVADYGNFGKIEFEYK